MDRTNQRGRLKSIGRQGNRRLRRTQMSTSRIPCLSCNKTFSTDFSLRRHTAVCGGKGGASTRKKACDSCRKAKARCNLQDPCSRCSLKGLNCDYGDQPGISSGVSSSSHSERTGSVPASDPLNHNLTNLEGQAASQIDDSALPKPGDYLWIPAAVGPALNSTFHENAAYGYRTLRYYTRQFARQSDRQLSPFIHIQHVNQAPSHSPLSMLLSLSKMCEVLTPENEELVYGMIASESARLLNLQIQDLPSSIEQLAVLQALVSYAILLYFSDKPGNQSIVDGAYLLRMQKLSQAIWNTGAITHPQSDSGWAEWVFQESTHRTFIIIHMLEFVIYVARGFTAIRCEAFSHLPLPSVKKLWEASNEWEWQALWKGNMSSNMTLKVRDLFDTDIRRDDVMAWIDDMGGFGSAILVSCMKGHIVSHGNG